MGCRDTLSWNARNWHSGEQDEDYRYLDEYCCCCEDAVVETMLIV